MRVLLIEDDSATAQSIELMLKSESFNVYTTDLGEEGVDLGKLYDYDIILLDLNFETGMNGLSFLEEIAGHWHEMHVIVVSIDAKRGSDVCREAFRRGAVACFDKGEVLRSGRELIELMHDLVSDAPREHRRFSRAITLPAVRA